MTGEMKNNIILVDHLVLISLRVLVIARERIIQCYKDPVPEI